MTREECYEWYKKFQKIGVGYDPETAKTFPADRWFNAILGEELGRVWPSLAAILGYQAFAAMILIASDETRNRLLPRLNQAELIGTIAVTEPEAGSDNRMITTSATPEGDDYVINGRKTWITNGTVADVALVAAISKETGRLDFFLLDRETAPWEVGELHKIGWKACPTGDRERTGKGKMVDISMRDVMFYHNLQALAFRALERDREKIVSVLGRTVDKFLADPNRPVPFWYPYPAKDGHVAVVALTDRQWEGLMRAMGREDLIQDSRFATIVDRIRNAEAGVEVIKPWMAGRGIGEITEKLRAHGVPCGRG